MPEVAGIAPVPIQELLQGLTPTLIKLCAVLVISIYVVPDVIKYGLPLAPMYVRNRCLAMTQLDIYCRSICGRCNHWEYRHESGILTSGACNRFQCDCWKFIPSKGYFASAEIFCVNKRYYDD